MVHAKDGLNWRPGESKHVERVVLTMQLTNDPGTILIPQPDPYSYPSNPLNPVK